MDAQAMVDAVVKQPSADPDASVTQPDGIHNTTADTPNGIRSSPPIPSQNGAMRLDQPNFSADEAGGKSDSEAETIVLPGKDGHSPSKIRKSIKHEDKSEDEEIQNTSGASNRLKRVAAGTSTDNAMVAPGETTATSMLGKRKRMRHGADDTNTTHMGNSSGLSSVPTSPVATTRSSLSKPAASDSEVSRSASPHSRSRSIIRDKAKSVDRVVPGRRQYTSASGDEEIESRTSGKQRGSGADHKSKRPRGHNEINPRKRSRSISPQSSNHKRSISTQLPSKSSQGLSHKKKRIPAPLQSTEYHSDESSGSGDSHPRSTRLRSLAAPITGESALSPAKMAPHKKNVNSSGQTLLSSACNRGKLDIVKQRYQERPDDLNFPDNALNTPLHTASLAGHVEVVKFLLETGKCELDCVNTERDTPLHDAVDNQNVEVVKLLLKAGANPGKSNNQGKEPLDLLDDMEGKAGDDAEDKQDRIEMREAILAAKVKFARHRRGSDDHNVQDNGHGRLSHPRESPRQTPPANELQGPPNRIVRTARSSMKTKDSGLWAGHSMEDLQKAASEGDLEAVYRILNVTPDVDDPKSLYNAARGGHDNVINLLFAIGSFTPDPSALDGVPSDQATPILAAIGKDNHIEVIKLFLGNSEFDPTRQVKGETYYELAKRRAGPHWQEEERLFKEAFNCYKKSHKNFPGTSRSPGTRRDGRDSNTRKPSTEEQSSRSHKRSTSSPKTRDTEARKPSHRSTSSLGQSKDGQNIVKRGPGRPRKEESAVSVSISDREASPLGPPKQKKQTHRAESDVTLGSENEPAVKPRRKLVSGREMRGERELEKQRRTSVVSSASTTSAKEKRVSTDSNQDRSDGKPNLNVSRVPRTSSSTHSDRDESADKNRAWPPKRDDSKDRLSAIRGESPLKRPRKSETPPLSGMQEMTAASDQNGPNQKKRKLDSDATSGHKTDSSSPEHRTAILKSGLSRGSMVKSSSDIKTAHTRHLQKSSEIFEDRSGTNVEKTSHRVATSGRSAPTSPSENSKRFKLPKERVSKEVMDEPAPQVAKSEEDDSLKFAKLQKRQEAEAEIARQKELEDHKSELARQNQLAREIAEREEEEKLLQEEAVRQEHQRVEAEHYHRKLLEEKEAKAKAVFQEQERVKKEDAERRRAVQEEAKRLEKARIDKERKDARLAKLPLLLRWFDLTFDQPNGHQSSEVVNLFKKIVGYRYDTIKPEVTGEAVGREQWMLNTHAAILLGEQDLHLSRFSAWDRIPLTHDQKRAVWSTHNSQYLLYDGWTCLRKALPSIDESRDETIKNNRALFLDLDLFFVKVSEFMFIVPTIPHLRAVQLKVEYRELQEPRDPLDLGLPMNTQKWRSDPETAPGQKFMPEPKFYVNGEVFTQGVAATRILKYPPPLDRFPRREGVTRVQESDPDYEEQCRKQGLTGYHSSPVSSTNPQMNDLMHPEQINGITPPRSDLSINGGSPHRSSGSGPESQVFHHLTNGISTSGSPPPSLG